MKKIKINPRITDHLIQAIFIFTSVFFAFWLTEYRENNSKKKSLEISLRHLATEMNYNHQRIEKSFAYFNDLITEIDSLKKDTDWERMFGNELKSWRGMQTPRLRSTAYHTFLNKGINYEADFEMAKSLESIYNLQLIVENLDKAIFEEATRDNSFTSLSKIRHQFGIYNEILPQLLMAYQNQGKEILRDFGYQAEISNEQLIAIISHY